MDKKTSPIVVRFYLQLYAQAQTQEQKQPLALSTWLPADSPH